MFGFVLVFIEQCATDECAQNAMSLLFNDALTSSPQVCFESSLSLRGILPNAES